MGSMGYDWVDGERSQRRSERLEIEEQVSVRCILRSSVHSFITSAEQDVAALSVRKFRHERKLCLRRIAMTRRYHCRLESRRKRKT